MRSRWDKFLDETVIPALRLQLEKDPKDFKLEMFYTGSTLYSKEAPRSDQRSLQMLVIVGLGSDVVFVYTDFWADSRLRKVNFGSRMTWTLVHAGKASLATSVLKPLREFGFFMGLCVIVVWVLLSLVYVPLCMVDEYWCGRPMPDDGTRDGLEMYPMISGSEAKGATSDEFADEFCRRGKYTRVIQRFRRSICLFPAGN
eukprot:Skav210936  [mRNA]  locus=scaffold713:106238:109421:+ [translate_table: standard]